MPLPRAPLAGLPFAGLLADLSSDGGRTPRRRWWLGSAVLLGANGAIEWALRTGLADGPARRGLVALVGLLFLVPSFNLSARRFQDRGRPGALAWVGVGVGGAFAGLALAGPAGAGLLAWVSGAALLVALWLVVEQGLLPGEPGPNRHGPPPQ